MNGPWEHGWDVLISSVIGGWRVWAGFQSLRPALVAASGIWLRRIWQTKVRTGDEGPEAPRRIGW